MTNCSFIFVDDDPINNLICRMTLDIVVKNVPSQSFINPKLALEYIRDNFIKNSEECPAILLLDINMPVMSGWEFLDRFDALDISIKEKISIYVLSSSVDERDRERSYANKNVAGFIVKPLTKETILAMIEETKVI